MYLLSTSVAAAGDYAAAGLLLIRSLADRERMQGPRDAATMVTRERLAAACLAEGKFQGRYLALQASAVALLRDRPCAASGPCRPGTR
jgi:hypothetical protein